MSARAVILPPLVIAVLMALCAHAIFLALNLRAPWLLPSYVEMSATVTLVAVLGYSFLEVAKLAKQRADHPLRLLVAKLRPRLPLLVLPALVAPLFLASYTTAKSGILPGVGFHWDRFWTEADFLIFGEDPWRITHRYLGAFATEFWAFLYTVLWGGSLVFTKALVTLYAPPRRVGEFLTSMLLTWFVGGFILAYFFSSAGPVFAHLFDPVLAERFAPLRSSLDSLLAPDNAVRQTQAYLANAAQSELVIKGSGISAMPSMHIATVSIYVLAARGNWLFWPAVAFWLLIFVGSVHFGYHYAVDAPVAALIAMISWSATRSWFGRDLPTARSRKPKRA